MIGASRKKRRGAVRDARPSLQKTAPVAGSPPAERRSGPRPPRRGRLKLYFQRHAQAMLYSLGRIFRAPVTSLMTIAVIGIALALPTGMYVALQNIQGISAGWETAAQISLFLKMDTGEQAARQLAGDLEGLPDVAAVTYISPAQALEDFRVMSGFGAALDVLDENPLPPVLVVRPAVDKGSAANVERLLEQLRERPEVDIAQLDMEWVKRLFAIIEIGQRGVMVLAVLLAAAVLLVIGNTIRLAINNRREEIEVKKLIGATDAFIRRPFLYFGFWYGVFGGVLAWLLVGSSLLALRDPVRQLALLYESSYMLAGISPGQTLFLFIISGLLGVIGSWLAVGRHLSAIEPS